MAMKEENKFGVLEVETRVIEGGDCYVCGNTAHEMIQAVIRARNASDIYRLREVIVCSHKCLLAYIKRFELEGLIECMKEIDEATHRLATNIKHLQREASQLIQLLQQLSFWKGAVFKKDDMDEYMELSKPLRNMVTNLALEGIREILTRLL